VALSPRGVRERGREGERGGEKRVIVIEKSGRKGVCGGGWGETARVELGPDAATTVLVVTG